MSCTQNERERGVTMLRWFGIHKANAAAVGNVTDGDNVITLTEAGASQKRGAAPIIIPASIPDSKFSTYRHANAQIHFLHEGLEIRRRKSSDCPGDLGPMTVKSHYLIPLTSGKVSSRVNSCSIGNITNRHDDFVYVQHISGGINKIRSAWHAYDFTFGSTVEAKSIQENRDRPALGFTGYDKTNQSKAKEFYSVHLNFLSKVADATGCWISASSSSGINPDLVTNWHGCFSSSFLASLKKDVSRFSLKYREKEIDSIHIDKTKSTDQFNFTLLVLLRDDCYSANNGMGFFFIDNKRGDEQIYLARPPQKDDEAVCILFPSHLPHGKERFRLERENNAAATIENWWLKVAKNKKDRGAPSKLQEENNNFVQWLRDNAGTATLYDIVSKINIYSETIPDTIKFKYQFENDKKFYSLKRQLQLFQIAYDVLKKDATRLLDFLHFYIDKNKSDIDMWLTHHSFPGRLSIVIRGSMVKPTLSGEEVAKLVQDYFKQETMNCEKKSY